MDLNLLVVDDDPASRAVLAEQLETWRIRHTTVGDVGTALELIRAGHRNGMPPGAVLIGNETLARELRNEVRAAAIPAIVFGPEDTDGCRESGPRRFRATC